MAACILAFLGSWRTGILIEGALVTRGPSTYVVVVVYVCTAHRDPPLNTSFDFCS